MRPALPERAPPISHAASLTALARVIVPQAFEDHVVSKVDLESLLEARIAGAPQQIRRDLRLVLRALDNVVFRLLAAGTTRSWSGMAIEERALRFARLGDSRVGTARTVYEVTRRLVLSTWYGTAEAHEDVGVLEPLHRRKPVVSWEGPVEGIESGVESVVAVSSREQLVPRASPARGPLPRSVTRGTELRGHLELRADVVVIGSGAGGSVAAARLAEAGKEVVILEQGPYLSAPDFDEDEGSLFPRLFADAGMRTTSDASIALLQGGAAGGGTTVNWMLMLRTPEFVLDEWRHRFGLTFAAPATLDPIFERIESETHTGLVPDNAHSPSNRAILTGARTLGWRASAARINALGCVRAGTCSLGCRYDAKQSALVTWLPRAFAHSARLFSDTRVRQIELIERSTGGAHLPLKRVRAFTADPVTGLPQATLTIEAPIVIVAAGAVESPALLMRSGMGGGAVGRFLRLHPTTAVTGDYDDEMHPLAGIPQSALCDEFIQRGDREYGFWIEVPALEPALAAAAASGFGGAHREHMRGLRRSVPLIALIRDGADRELSNGEVRVDRRGNTRVSYRLGPSDRKTLEAALEATTKLHFAAGARRARTLHTRQVVMDSPAAIARLRTARNAPNEIGLFSAHVNGTCRMGTDRRSSATSPAGERWGARGVYVCDGSLLPTSPGVNPQETIMALATLVAEGICQAP